MRGIGALNGGTNTYTSTTFYACIVFNNWFEYPCIISCDIIIASAGQIAAQAPQPTHSPYADTSRTVSIITFIHNDGIDIIKLSGYLGSGKIFPRVFCVVFSHLFP